MLRKIFAAATLCLLVVSQAAIADEQDRRQAKRIFDRLAGTPPTNDVLNDMELAMIADPTGRDAADIALSDPAFYNVTLKNWAAPWSNEEETVFTDLNDFTATIIGMVRDDVDFRQILYGDIIYVGDPGLSISAYSNTNNNHYVELDALDLSDENVMIQQPQSTVTGLASEATAGVITSRAAAKSFFYLGTNRAMFRFTMMNHLCNDLEPIKDNSRVPNRVHRDVARSPGGDSRIYLNNCVGCHAGMDGLLGGYAYYDLSFSGDKDTDVDTFNNSAQLSYTPGTVAGKYLINANNFPQGHETVDDSWINYWRQGPNSLLGWNDDYPDVQYDTTIAPDEGGNQVTIGNGAKSMGMELAHSDAFASCQVKKAFKAICLRDPDDYAADRAAVASITTDFTTDYHMKQVFRDVAAYCKGE